MSTPSTSSRSSSSTQSMTLVDSPPAQPPSRPRERKLSTSKRLAAAATQHLRASHFGPSFLQDLAKQGMPPTYDNARDGKFRIVTGPEATELAQNFLNRKGSGLRKPHQQPVVLALPRPVEAGRKVVDMWRSWKGDVKTHRKQGTGDLIGDEFDKSDKLDKAFDKAIKTLEREYKRQSITLEVPVNEEALARSDSRKSNRSDRTSRSARSDVPSSRSHRGQESSDKGDTSPAQPPSKPLSSFGKTNSSVASLPLLNMMPNVPLSHQPKLRIVNPDSSSKHSKSAHSHSTGRSKETHRRRYNSESPAPLSHSAARNEGASLRRTSSDKPENGSEELLIGLVDENTTTWHGLDRRASTRSPQTRNAVRESPWNGPLARSSTLPYGSSRRRYEVPLEQPSEDSNDDGESSDDDYPPVVPMPQLLELTGRIPPSYPASYASPPVVPLNVSQSRGSTPAPVIPNYSPYSTGSSLSAGSPFISAYNTPQTPLRPLSSTYPYAHPYGGIPL
ncbi:hypothetical protein EV121DRAFT_289672 [Schizophyllum commune]